MGKIILLREQLETETQKHGKQEKHTTLLRKRAALTSGFAAQLRRSESSEKVATMSFRFKQDLFQKLLQNFRNKSLSVA